MDITHSKSFEQPDYFWHSLSIFDHTKVLLVEDDPATRWIVRSALKNDCCLATAGTASQAFIRCQTYHPDIVFLDLDLPDKKGADVFEWIIRNDPGVKVILFTSTQDIEQIYEILNRGACGYIPKPFEKELFMNYIKGNK